MYHVTFMSAVQTLGMSRIIPIFTNEMRRNEGKTAEMSLKVLVVTSLYTVTFEFSPQDLKTNPVKSNDHFMRHFL